MNNADEMRKLMNLTESQTFLNYQGQVDKIVQLINRANPDGITKADFEKAVDVANTMVDASALRKINTGANQKPSTAKRDFLKDVAAQITFVRAKPKNQKPKVADVLFGLADMIAAAVGNSFPDGDPFDTLEYQVRDKYNIRVDDLMKWLDRAAKKHLGSKSYFDYLAQVWDDNIDNYRGATQGRMHSRNPWR